MDGVQLEANRKQTVDAHMSSIEQLCPSCNRMLELPESAVGRLAKCPACEATFTLEAAAVPESTPVDESGPVVQTSAPYATGQSSGDEPAEVSSTSPSESPFSAPLESSIAGDGGSHTGRMNPYQPMHAVDPIAEIGELRIVPRTIEDIFSPTFSIFGARWGTLLLAIVVVGAASIPLIVVPRLVIIAILEAGGDVFAAIALLIGVPLMFLFSFYVSVGLVRNAIAVARNSPSPLMELLPPLNIVVRFMIGAVVMMAAAGAVFGLFFGLIAALVAVGGNETFAGILAVLGILTGIALAMVVYWLLWPWMFIVSDGKGTALGSIKAAYTLTMHNKLTSVFLIVIATVLSTAGTAACYVGLLVTQPLTNLMFAVAYLLMTNQQIDDPRVKKRTYETPPPPTKPTF